MPPKKISKEQLQNLSAPKQQPKPQAAEKESNDDFVDMPNSKQNMKTLTSTRTVIAILIGIFCGIINVNQILAVVLYAAVQVLVSPLILLSTDYKSNFVEKKDVLSGITGSILMFVCSWMISYNLVYTL